MGVRRGEYRMEVGGGGVKQRTRFASQSLGFRNEDGIQRD
jgi:hypothetical protein